MKIKKYEATDMKEALKLIKEELGSEAVILSTKKITKSTGLGLFPRTVLEVTAATDYEKNKYQADAEKLLVKSRTPVRNEKPRPAAVSKYNEVANFDETDEENDILSEIFKNNEVTATAYVQEEKVEPEKAEESETEKFAHLLSVTGLDKVPSILEEISEIKKQLNDMKVNMENPVNLNVDLSTPFKDFYTLMTKNGLDEIIAYRFLKRLEKNTPDMLGKGQLKTAVLDEFAKQIPVETSYVLALNKKITAFIGPTGVGKTTSLAKIAADLVLKYTQKVCLITVDNFRIGAIEQLRTYAEIVNLPLYVATSPVELEKVLSEVANEYDYIFIDSTGRSPYDDVSLSDNAEFLASYPDMVPVLVLSAATNPRELNEMYDKYAALQPEFLLFTKLDETRYYGSLANIPIKKKTPLLLLSTGQGVPEDMEAPDGKKIAKKLLQEIPLLWNEN